MEELTLQEIVKQYIAVSEMGGQAPKTIKEKRNSLLRFVGFVAERPLTAKVAFDYIIYLKTKPVRPYKNNSIIFEIAILRTFEKFMIDQGYCTDKWTRLLKPPKKEVLKDFVYLSPEVIEKSIILGTEPIPFVKRGLPGDHKLNKYRKLEARTALRFASRTGLRISEILRLKGSDLNFDAPAPEFRIAPSKGHKETSAWIPADMIEELRERKDRMRLFETTENLCNDSLKRGLIASGVTAGKLRNHKLRHQFLTNLLKSGASLAVVQKAARHSSIKVTIDTYGHLDRSDIDPVVQAADPRTRSVLTFEDQVAFVQQTIDKLNLKNNNTISIGIASTKDEFTFTLKREDSNIATR